MEINEAIQGLERHKTRGSHQIPIEFCKELEEGQLYMIQEVLNQWWVQEFIPEEALLAKIVPISKEGDKEDLSKYRPISLCNTLYKTFAVIIQTRLADGLHLPAKNTIWIHKKQKEQQMHCNVSEE